MDQTTADGAQRHKGLSFVSFVTLIASLMAINALSIDAMLPALPDIGRSLNIESENARQWVVTSYLLGFGVAQIIYGPIADRFGRRPVLLIALLLYTACTLLAGFAWSFEVMITVRVLQGIGAAGSRVLAMAVVRDCYSGRTMAKVMSLTFIVFLTAPIIAPSIGQLIILAAPWRWIFIGLAIFAALTATSAALRLPETLHPEDRLPISAARLASAFKTALTTRTSVGYMLAQTATIGALFGFVTSSQQVIGEALGAGKLFSVVFAAVAVTMAFSSFTNSRIVERLGMRKVSHGALLGFIAVAAIHAAVAWSGHETLLTFAVLQGLMMFNFGMLGANFNAIAMQPLGHIAGTASSVQGFVTTTGGALIGSFIGQHYDGTSGPLTLGFVACGLAALTIVLVTEGGRLFRDRGGR